MSTDVEQLPYYTGPRVVATGPGVFVAFVSCLRCGACLTIDKEDGLDVLEVHMAWHADLVKAGVERPSKWPFVVLGSLSLALGAIRRACGRKERA